MLLSYKVFHITGSDFRFNETIYFIGIAKILSHIKIKET